MSRHFMQMQQEKWDQGFFSCVGLDSDIAKIPVHIRSNDVTETLFIFNKAIIETNADLVSHFKLQISFYEMLGTAGLLALKKTIQFIRDLFPDIPIILDAKRADIDTTNLGYIVAAFDYLGADAITVHPYLGGHALLPFFERRDKGIIVLCRTSNMGAGEFQDRPVLLRPEELRFFSERSIDHLIDEDGTIAFYQYVAYRVAEFWGKKDPKKDSDPGNKLLVMGATYPEEMPFVREIVGDVPFLIPGVGAQQGDLESSVKNGKNSKKQGMIFNNSRGVIFASSGPDFALEARQRTLDMHTRISACLA